MEQFIKICRQWGLGELISEPCPLTGGLMHKMYRLITDKGSYALKLLNPYVMQRKTAKKNFETAEQLEDILERAGLPILPARTIDGQKMQEMNGQYFYLFDWYDGKTLHGADIHKNHCWEMGKVLAKIHRIHWIEKSSERTPLHIDWNFYYKAVKGTDQKFFDLLEKQIPLLYEMQERVNRTSGHVPGVSAICHNDMDSKNVLWKGMEYRVIDLECLSYANPLVELLETALCWSGFEECCFDAEKFCSFIKAYTEQAPGLLEGVDWESLYDSGSGKLLWLEYSLKRTLGFDCEKSEQELGRSEAIRELQRIFYYNKMRSTVLNSVR